MVSRFELEDLVGLEVSAVCFIRDYVELHFDGPILRSLSDPLMDIGGTRVQYPRPDSRDTLCRLIGSTVQSAAEDEHNIMLVFADRSMISIPKSSGVAGPEVAHLVPYVNGRLDVAGMLVWENLCSPGVAEPE